METALKSLPSIRLAALVKEHGQTIERLGDQVYLQILEVGPAFVDVAKIDLKAGSIDVPSMDAFPIGLLGAAATASIEAGLGGHLPLGFDGYRIGGILE